MMMAGVPPEIALHRPAAHGGPYPAGTARRAGQGRRRGRHALLDFSSNVSPLGPPPAAAAAMAAAAAGRAGSEYPDPESSRLRAALASYVGAGSASNIAVGCGATEIIYDFCRAFAARRGARVLVQAPTFAEYEAAARLGGAVPSFFPSMDLGADASRFAEAVPRGGCAFVCTPNNPTGAALGRRQVLEIASAAADASAMLLVDECFAELADCGPSGRPCTAESASVAAVRRPNMVVVRSLTKSFGLAGARVGYAVGAARTVRALSRIKVPWTVSGPAQAGAIEALRHPGHVERARHLVSRERARLVSEVGRIDGFACVGRPQANFVLVRTRRPSADVRSALERRGILVRDCSSFRGLGRGGSGYSAHHMRVAVRTAGENKRLVCALRRI